MRDRRPPWLPTCLAWLSVSLSTGCFFDFNNPVEDEVGAGIRGRVVAAANEGGAGFAGATVRLAGVPVNQLTDADGAFAFEALPAGRYDLVVEASSAGSTTVDLRVQRLGIELEADRGVTLNDIMLESAGAARGVVRLEGRSLSGNSGVRALIVGTEDVALSGADGEVLLPSLAGGPQEIVLAAPGFRVARVEVDIVAGGEVSFSTAESPTRLAAVSEASLGIATGRVLREPDASGEDHAGSGVRLIDAEGNAFPSAPESTDDAGEYTLLDVPEGIYTLEATHPDFDTLLLPNVVVFGGSVNQGLRAGESRQAQTSGTRLPTVVLKRLTDDCDRDGMPDIEDNDDDNDGVIDADEAPGCRCQPAGSQPVDGRCVFPPANTPPLARITDNAGMPHPRRVTVGESVTLSATRSFDGDGDTLSYAWWLSDPADAQRRGDEASFTFLAALEGDHRIELVVDDGQVTSLAAALVITVGAAGPPPVARLQLEDRFGLPLPASSIALQQEAIFNAGGSTSDETALEDLGFSFSIDPATLALSPPFGEDAPAWLVGLKSEEAGMWTVQVEVRDRAQRDTEQLAIEVLDRTLPEISLSGLPDQGELVEGNVVFSAFAVEDDGGSVEDSAIRWLDANGELLATGGLYEFEASPGALRIFVEVTDSAGLVAREEVALTIVPAPQGPVWLSPASADFGEVSLQRSGIRELSVENLTDAAVEAVASLRNGDAGFSVFAPSDGQLTVPAQGSSPLQLVFEPQAVGEASDVLELRVDDALVAEAALSATAVPLPLHVSGPVPSQVARGSAAVIYVHGAGFVPETRVVSTTESVSVALLDVEPNRLEIRLAGPVPLGRNAVGLQAVNPDGERVDFPDLLGVYPEGLPHYEKPTLTALWPDFATLVAMRSGGLYLLRDGIATRLTSELIGADIEAVAAQDVDSPRVWVVRRGDEGSVVMLSEDYGATFRTLVRSTESAFFFNDTRRILAAPLQEPTALLATAQGPLLVQGTSASFLDMGMAPGPVADLAAHPELERFYLVSNAPSEGLWTGDWSSSELTRVATGPPGAQWSSVTALPRGADLVLGLYTSGFSAHAALISYDGEDLGSYDFQANFSGFGPAPVSLGASSLAVPIPGGAVILNRDDLGEFGENLLNLGDVLPIQGEDSALRYFNSQGMWRWTDSAGSVAQTLSGLDGFDVSSADVDPRQPDRVVWWSGDTGYLSEDGGQNVTRTFLAGNADGARVLRFSPRDSELFALKRVHPTDGNLIVDNSTDLAQSFDTTWADAMRDLGDSWTDGYDWRAVEFLDTSDQSAWYPYFVGRQPSGRASYLYYFDDRGRSERRWSSDPQPAPIALLPGLADVADSPDFVVSTDSLQRFQRSDRSATNASYNFAPAPEAFFDIAGPRGAATDAVVGSDVGLLRFDPANFAAGVDQTLLRGVPVPEVSRNDTHTLAVLRRSDEVATLSIFDGSVWRGIDDALALVPERLGPRTIQIAWRGQAPLLYGDGIGAFRGVTVADLLATNAPPQLIAAEFFSDGDGECRNSGQMPPEGLWLYFDETVSLGGESSVPPEALLLDGAAWTSMGAASQPTPGSNAIFVECGQDEGTRIFPSAAPVITLVAGESAIADADGQLAGHGIPVTARVPDVVP